MNSSHALDVWIWGGGRGIGRWMARFLPTAPGVRITAFDLSFPRDPPMPESVTRRVILEQGNALALGDEIGLGPPTDRILHLLAVPTTSIAAVARLILELDSTPTLAYLTSVQGDAAVALSAVIPGAQKADPTYVFGLHPLFGPLVASPVGQVVSIALPEANPPPNVTRFLDALQAIGLRPSYFSPADHDKRMLYVQTLVHFLLIGFLDVVSQGEFQLEELFELQTPPFRVMSALAGRLVGSAPETYASIQEAPNAQAIRAEAISLLSSLDLAIAGGRAVEYLTNVRTRISGTAIQETVAASRALAESVQGLDLRLMQAKSSGEIVIAGNQTRSARHVGRVKKVDALSIDLERLSGRVANEDSEEPVAVDIGGNARANYARNGVQLPKSDVVTLAKRGLVLVDGLAAQKWIRDRCRYLSEDFTLTTDVAVQDYIFKYVLPAASAEISNVVLRDTYRRGTDQYRVTFTVDYRPDVDLVELCNGLETAARDAIGRPVKVAPATDRRLG